MDLKSKGIRLVLAAAITSFTACSTPNNRTPDTSSTGDKIPTTSPLSSGISSKAGDIVLNQFGQPAFNEDHMSKFPPRYEIQHSEVITSGTEIKVESETRDSGVNMYKFRIGEGANLVDIDFAMSAVRKHYVRMMTEAGIENPADLLSSLDNRIPDQSIAIYSVRSTNGLFYLIPASPANEGVLTVEGLQYLLFYDDPSPFLTDDLSGINPLDTMFSQESKVAPVHITGATPDQDIPVISMIGIDISTMSEYLTRVCEWDETCMSQIDEQFVANYSLSNEQMTVIANEWRRQNESEFKGFADYWLDKYGWYDEDYEGTGHSLQYLMTDRVKTQVFDNYMLEMMFISANVLDNPENKSAEKLRLNKLLFDGYSRLLLGYIQDNYPEQGYSDLERLSVDQVLNLFNEELGFVQKFCSDSRLELWQLFYPGYSLDQIYNEDESVRYRVSKLIMDTEIEALSTIASIEYLKAGYPQSSLQKAIGIAKSRNSYRLNRVRRGTGEFLKLRSEQDRICGLDEFFSGKKICRSRTAGATLLGKMIQLQRMLRRDFIQNPSQYL
ncbi:hypothetical protein JW887_05545 [Candidatus Dojkabacteria bacterium]|nr:hypothetical protein [Candidatus Dojkabacteria bacterium]